MKKYLSILILIVICFSSVILTGCQQDENLWNQVYQNVTEFKANEKYRFLINNSSEEFEVNVDYSVSNQEQQKVVLLPIDPSYPEYYHLTTIYGEILDKLLIMFNKYSSALEVKPAVIDKDVNEKYTNFNNQLTEFQKAIDTFLEKKEVFLNSVQKDFNSSRSLSLLKDFKRNYADLIYSARDFNKSFEELYTTAYKGIPHTIGQNADNGLEKLVGCVTINRLTSVYLSYYFDDFDKVTPTLGINFSLLTSLKELKESMKNSNLKQNRIELLNTWLSNYKLFDREVEVFSIALEQVDLNDFVVNYQANKQNFLKNNPTLKTYFYTIENFIENSSSIILNSTKILFD